MRLLSPEREDEIRELRANVREHIPELVPFIKDLVDAGVVEGWRCLRRFRMNTDPPWPPQKAYPAWKTGKEFIAKEKS